MIVYYTDSGEIDTITPRLDDDIDLNYMEVEVSEVEDMITGKVNIKDYRVTLRGGTPSIIKPEVIEIPLTYKKYLKHVKKSRRRKIFDILVDNNQKKITLSLTNEYKKSIIENDTTLNFEGVGSIEIFFCDERNYKFVYFSANAMPTELIMKDKVELEFENPIPTNVICMTKSFFDTTSFRMTE